MLYSFDYLSSACGTVQASSMGLYHPFAYDVQGIKITHIFQYNRETKDTTTFGSEDHTCTKLQSILFLRSRFG